MRDFPTEVIRALGAVPTSGFDWETIAAVVASRGNPQAANRIDALHAAIREHAPWLLPPPWKFPGPARRRCRRCGELVAAEEAEGEPAI